MKPDDLALFRHLIDIARKGVDLSRGLSRAEFDDDETVRLALAMVLQQFGETARRVSMASRSIHASIPWAQIVGMRHKIVHDYLYIDYDIVWDVVIGELPRLLPELEGIVGDWPQSPVG